MCEPHLALGAAPIPAMSLGASCPTLEIGLEGFSKVLWAAEALPGSRSFLGWEKSLSRAGQAKGKREEEKERRCRSAPPGLWQCWDLC